MEEDATTNSVDGKSVPVPHYGVILDWNVFKNLSKDLKNKCINFIIESYIRFEGLVGEQTTMFLKDPIGNPL